MVSIDIRDISDPYKRRQLVDHQAPLGATVRVNLRIADPPMDAYQRSTLHLVGTMLGWVRDSHQSLWQHDTAKQPFALHVTKSWDAGRYYGQSHSQDTGSGFVVLIDTADVISITSPQGELAPSDRS